MKKRLLSLFLVICMVLGMLPVSVFAEETETEVPSVTVYFSISDDANYLTGPGTEEVMALKEIEVPYFDLGLYGLESFYFSSEEYGSDGGDHSSELDPGTAEYAYGKITMLHLFIYALEVYYCGVNEEEAGQGYLYDYGLMGTEVLDIGGSTGSSFLNYIWGVDMNLNYYLNYEYPLASEGWGATSDQILLHDGDIVTLGHFTGWSFYNDSTSIFNYIEADAASVTQGQSVNLTLYHAGADFSGNYTTAHTVVDYCPDVYYIALEDMDSGDVTEWNYLGTADENGEIVLDTTALVPGDYMVAIAGQYGAEYSDEICSTPGGVLLTVEAAAHTHSYTAVVTEPTCTEGGYTTYTCECGDSYVTDETDALGHNYVAGTCSRCGEINPDYVAPTATVYMTVSKSYNFIEAGDTTMALVEMTVPYFDIGLYGLEDIYYNPDCYANGAYGVQVGGTPETADGVVTMLHVIIWATEVYYNGISPEEAGKGWLANEGNWNGFGIGKNPGSAFMSFWGFGGNVNYYLNYEYPLGAPGWGATADQIVVTDGDVLSFRYNAWTGNDGTYYHFGESGIVTETAVQGEKVTLTLYSTSESWTDYTTGHNPVGEGEWVYVIPAADMQGEHWDVAMAEYTTDANGSVVIDTKDMAPGTYYITSDTHDPAVMILVVEEAETVESVPMYRLYDLFSGEHFYTGNAEERDMLLDCGWQYEGVAWYAPTEGAPVYRVYNPNSGDHHYTMAWEEVEMLEGYGWRYEGIGWYSASEEGVPVYRVWNVNADRGSHHYTCSEEERDWLVSLGWIYEGIGWYGVSVG